MSNLFKPFLASCILTLLTTLCSAQYYYKDLIVTRLTARSWQEYRKNNVKGIMLTSLEASGQPSEGFEGQQDMTDLTRIVTHTKATGTPESWLFAYYSATGWPTRTVDSSENLRSVSEYRYDVSGHLLSITNTSTQIDNKLKEQETHLWQYDAKGQPATMLKIKGSSDTTFVRFVRDDKGNISEEHAARNHTDLPTVFYYYDTEGHLTDIVRYNERAHRLLPDYLFEYEDGRISSMLVVPAGSSDYQKWHYVYNEQGLKVKEFCYNRQKQLMGSIEYNYKY